MQLPDMNLLVALDALLDEGSVVGAARRMNLSPAAMSRTLTRIREAIGDPILVRAGRGLVPTPRHWHCASRCGTWWSRRRCCSVRRTQWNWARCAVASAFAPMTFSLAFTAENCSTRWSVKPRTVNYVSFRKAMVTMRRCAKGGST